MNRKFLYKISPSVIAILIGLGLFFYKVVLSNIELPAPEDIENVQGTLTSYVKKNEGLLIKLNEFDDVFFFSHRAGDLNSVSQLLSSFKGKEIVILTKSNGAYTPYFSDDIYRLVFGVGSVHKIIITYEEISENWELKSRKNEVALIAFLFIIFGLLSIWKLVVNHNDDKD